MIIMRVSVCRTGNQKREEQKQYRLHNSFSNYVHICTKKVRRVNSRIKGCVRFGVDTRQNEPCQSLKLATFFRFNTAGSEAPAKGQSEQVTLWRE